MNFIDKIKLARVMTKLEQYANTSNIEIFAIQEAYEALKILKSRGTKPESWSDELTLFFMLTKQNFILPEDITLHGSIILEGLHIGETL